jgi:uncharacterized protein
VYYFDTSVVIPLYVKETTSSACQTFVNTHKGQLSLSQWTMAEVYSGFSLLKRTGVLSANDVTLLTPALEQQSKTYFSILDVQVSDFLTAKSYLAHNTFGLNLRAGDALHIAVAQNNSLNLVTSDKNMVQAARVLGVSLTQI